MESNYFQYTTKSRLDKAVSTLTGLLEGIGADKTVGDAEIKLLIDWVDTYRAYSDYHPYNELIPAVDQALTDGKFTADEQQDLLFLCYKLRTSGYYDNVTADVQRLQGLMVAISTDGLISEPEIMALRDWIDEHDYLRTCWPYDELDSLLTSVLSDHWIDSVEHKILLQYFASFASSGVTPSVNDTSPVILNGICAVMPEIVFLDRRFCFTGESLRSGRNEMREIVISRGGIVISAPSPKLDYLVVGSNGNPCWAYACYGRKIEQVMTLRQKGAKTLIVHENDFFDAVQ